MIPSITVGGIRVRFSLLFPAMLTVLCMQSGGQLTAICLLAAVMHECGHLVVLCCVRNRPKEIRFSAFGMCLLLQETPMRYRQQVLVALGGPAVNLLTAGFLFAVAGVSDAAGIHLLLGLVNLLPIWPLDGGQCLPASRVSEVISCGFLAILTAFAIYVATIGNVSLLAVSGYLWFRHLTKN